MDVQTITQFINGVGFPIFVAVYMMFNQQKSTNKVTESINANTLVIQKLCSKLDVEIDNANGSVR